MDIQGLGVGWASDGLVWHRIDVLAGFNNRSDKRVDLGLARCCVSVPQVQTEPEPPPDADLCRDCQIIDHLPEFVESAWGTPDEDLHMLTPPSMVWPPRFGHYHGMERAELRIRDPIQEGNKMTWPYRCSCGEQTTAVGWGTEP